MLFHTRPDHRWARVLDLSQYGESQAMARLSREDEPTRQAYLFYRDMARDMEDEHPELFIAYRLFNNEQAFRIMVEGLLIAGAEDEHIASIIGCDDPKIIQYYHDIFFDVRSKLDNPGWINAVIFQGMPHEGAHQGDRLGIMHRFAWFGGIELVEGLITRGLSNSSVIEKLMQMTKQILMRNAARTALTSSSNSEFAHEFLKLTLDDHRASSKEESNSSVDEKFVGAVDTFFSKITLTVADPSAKGNLILPAREPRVHETAEQVK